MRVRHCSSRTSAGSGKLSHSTDWPLPVILTADTRPMARRSQRARWSWPTASPLLESSRKHALWSSSPVPSSIQDLRRHILRVSRSPGCANGYTFPIAALGLSPEQSPCSAQQQSRAPTPERTEIAGAEQAGDFGRRRGAIVEPRDCIPQRDQREHHLAIQHHDLLERAALLAIALMDAGQLRECRSVDCYFHSLKIALCAEQRLCRRHGGGMQKSGVPARHAMLTPKRRLEQTQVFAALPQQLGELPADQEIVRAQLAFAAIEVVSTAVEQIGQQPLGRPGPTDGIGDDLQLHTPLAPDLLTLAPARPRAEACSRTSGYSSKAQSSAKTAHGTLALRRNCDPVPG